MATKTLTLVIELGPEDAISEEAFKEWGIEITDAVSEIAYVAEEQWGTRA